MKIAIVYNRESKSVINLFGVPNRERYGIRAIQRLVKALQGGGHQVIALEGDKDLIDKLEEFMPRALKGERPGMVFNLSYGIQGQARYTHVPGMLEMVGVPYVGSGPLAHSLSLDKVVAKMIFVQQGIPTPDFVVLDAPDYPDPEIDYPLIVKPKNEAVSMGIKIVNDADELKEAAGFIFEQFNQPVLVERYIEGREINVGLLGNGTPDVFPPAELVFGEGGPNIYTMEDKKSKSGREIKILCPAPLDEELTKKAQQISINAFNALGCYDCARVDLRLDDDGNFYILEINSLPSLGEHGSYVAAAEAMGMDFAALANRLIEVASARYFGTPNPPELTSSTRNPDTAAFTYLTQRRDRLEKKVEEWAGVSSRTDDPIGTSLAADKINDTLLDCGLLPMRELTDNRDVWCWQTRRGLDEGTLLIGFLDVPINPVFNVEHFRRDPEWLYGEGVGSSRASLAMLEYSLRALRAARKLNKLPLGILYYADEGRDCIESREYITRAARQAKQVLVLTPGNLDDHVVTARRGQRRYRLLVEGKPQKLGQSGVRREVMRIVFGKLEELAKLSSRANRIGVSAVDIESEAFPGLLPHRVNVMIQVSYPKQDVAKDIEQSMRSVLKGEGVKWNLALLSERPPMPERRKNNTLVREYTAIADKWDIPIKTEASLLPSAAGLAPDFVPVLCGVGPVARELYTSRESVSRISLVQRTLLLSEYLLSQAD